MPARPLAKSSPEQRSLHARLAAYSLHAKVADPSAHTAPARQAFLDRFEREVDPDGVLPPADRARRAESACKAHFTRMALRSAQARRRRPSSTVGLFDATQGVVA